MSQPNGHVNGNSSTSHLPSRDKSSHLSSSDAMSVLAEYSRGDGLSLPELMDSRKNGGLTYNDFLMLPGHISFPASVVSLQTK
jgi:IMP dehydrogenase